MTLTKEWAKDADKYNIILVSVFFIIAGLSESKFGHNK